MSTWRAVAAATAAGAIAGWGTTLLSAGGAGEPLATESPPSRGDAQQSVVATPNHGGSRVKGPQEAAENFHASRTVYREPPEEASYRDDSSPEREETRASEARARVDHWFAGAEEAFRAEVVDRSWAFESEQAVWAVLESQELEGTSATSVECKNRMCRLELTHSDRASQDACVDPLLVSLASLPSAAARFYKDEQPPRTVLFFGRSHDALPSRSSPRN